MLQSIYTHAGCDYGCLYTYSPRHCFNPHTHAGCDNVHNVSGASFPVSIHTPTQGVTSGSSRQVGIILVSIHTPTQGVTPTHYSFIIDFKVSIHTPTQGVTINKVNHFYPSSVSIHTPTQGVTILEVGLVLLILMFQSTHPRRV